MDEKCRGSADKSIHLDAAAEGLAAFARKGPESQAFRRGKCDEEITRKNGAWIYVRKFVE